jgi:hypothetical protein
VLTFRDDTLLGCDEKDLGDSIQCQKDKRFDRSEGVGEVDQGRYED